MRYAISILILILTIGCATPRPEPTQADIEAAIAEIDEHIARGHRSYERALKRGDEAYAQRAADGIAAWERRRLNPELYWRQNAFYSVWDPSQPMGACAVTGAGSGTAVTCY